MFRQSIPALILTFSLSTVPLNADEIEDNLKDALQAYQSGEVQEAKEILDFTSTLLDQQRTSILVDILPSPMSGWSKEEQDSTGSSAALAMLGGSGTMLSASYTHTSGKTINIQLMADTPMLAMIAPKFSNPAIMAQLGKVKRVNRQKVILDHDGGLQSLILGRFFIQMEGTASQEQMLEYFKLFDIKKLKEF